MIANNNCPYFRNRGLKAWDDEEGEYDLEYCNVRHEIYPDASWSDEEYVCIYGIDRYEDCPIYRLRKLIEKLYEMYQSSLGTNSESINTKKFNLYEFHKQIGGKK